MKTPAVLLINPKYPHNLAAAIRACSCFGVENLMWTGDRISMDATLKTRLPREERMKGYRDVKVTHVSKPFPPAIEGGRDLTPVCVEIARGTTSLVKFGQFAGHPSDAVYVFGPEDGGVPPVIKRHCHFFVHIPAHHCLNLAAAVNVVLYDRRLKGIQNGWEDDLPLTEMLKEHRGLIEVPGWDGK